MLKAVQAAFAVACYWGFSDIHECSDVLQMAPSPFDKQTASCDPPHDWLISLAMDLAALCDKWRWKWHQWMPFSCFQSRRSLCLQICGYPPTLIGVLLVLAMPVKKLLYSGKLWRGESLANHPWLTKLKPSKLVLTINNLLADLLICQTFIHQMLEKSRFAKLSRYTVSKMADNSASYPLNSWWIDRL